jgi:hypothetical protein
LTTLRVNSETTEKISKNTSACFASPKRDFAESFAVSAVKPLRFYHAAKSNERKKLIFDSRCSLLDARLPSNVVVGGCGLRIVHLLLTLDCLSRAKPKGSKFPRRTGEMRGWIWLSFFIFHQYSRQRMASP